MNQERDTPSSPGILFLQGEEHVKSYPFNTCYYVHI